MFPMTQTHGKNFSSSEVRVVEASAGSGKTYTLAKRYIQLLFNPSLKLEQIPIRNLLAITFTNKAAFEMKARILQFLKSIALGELAKSEYDEILAPLGIEPKEASQRAYTIMEAVIRHYNFFQVQTIDKFINALLSGCSFKIGLTANFRIKTNSSDYLECSLDELIDRAARDKDLKVVFDEFLHNYIYLENRTGWFPRRDMLAIIKTLFSLFNTYGLPFQESQLSPREIIKAKINILKDMNTLFSKLPEGTDKRFRDALEKFIAEHSGGFDIDSTSRYFLRSEFPANKGAEVPREVDRLWNKIIEALRQLCVDEAYSTFNPYIAIFKEVRQDFQRLAAKDDVLFLEELNKRAGSLFDEEHVTVEELYYRLATRFRHYLIDEFQDTSRLQWQNLQEMVREALSTGGTLFYVGDQKQAIYGFRGGDVRLFDDLKGEFSAYDVNCEQLSKNWRSHKAIVDFNNAVFSKENLANFIAKKDESEKNSKVILSGEEISDVLSVFHNAVQTAREDLPKGLVKITPIDGDKKEGRDEMTQQEIIALIGKLRERFSYKDIAILTRRNKEVEDVTNWLMEEGIPVESERTSNIKENQPIGELIAFLQFLSSPIDNISFADFILGDIFSKASNISKEDLHNFIFKHREELRKQKDFYLYMAFRQEYKQVWEDLLDEFFKNVGLYPLYELVVSIYNKFDCLKNFKGAQGFFMHFLELIKKQEEENADIAAFLEWYEDHEGEDLFVRMTDADAVKVLTIHKSKGLEFPVCIIPFLGIDVQVGAGGSDNKQSYCLRRSQAHMELVRLKSRYYEFSDELLAIYREEYKKEFLNELNNVYVALTRAQCELYAFIPLKVQKKTNPVQFLIPPEMYQVGEESPYIKTAKIKLPVEKLAPSRYHDWIDYLKEEFLLKEDFQNRQRRLRGEAVHQCLAFVGNMSGKKAADVLNDALLRVKFENPSIKDWEDTQKVLEKLFADKTLKRFFDCPGCQVLTEQEIVTKKGDTKRLDRLIVADKEVIVIDYKSGREPEGKYQKQVKEYMDLIASLYPNRKVKGYLVYLDSMEVEEVI